MRQKTEDRRRVSRTALLALCLVAVAGLVRAQTARVTGTVRDAGGQPIRGATIKAENAAATPDNFTATTDDKGKFSITGLQKGTWSLTVSAPGYQPSQGKAEISALASNPVIEVRLFKAYGGPPLPLDGVNTRELQGQLDAAEALLNARQYDQAIAAYQGVLAKVPSLTLVNLQIGNAYRLKKDYDRALAAYEQVLKADPANERARIGIGITNLEKGDLQEADETLSALAGEPRAAREAFYYLGEVKRARGRLGEAAAWYQKAADADPAWPKPYLRLGDISAEGGDGTAALGYYEKVVALAPASSEAAAAKTAIGRIRK
jgi:tetratricopeptide (TPR) repeat protein